MTTRSVWCGAALAALCVSPMAAAEPMSADAMDTQYLTGSWGGARAELAQRGYRLRGDLVSETMGVVDGGLENGLRYAQQLRVGADFDLQALLGWQGAAFHVTVNDRRGRSTSADLAGNRFPIQETFGGLYTKPTELSYTQNFFDGRLDIKAGFYAMGNNFASLKFGPEFVNAAFCAHPLSLSGNSGWYNYPTARWGAEFGFKLTPELAVRTGWFQVNPRYAHSDVAWDLGASGTTGSLVPVELHWTPGSASGGRYPGYYRVGYYYDSSDVAKKGQDGTAHHRQGAWIFAEQKVYSESDANARGLFVFAQYTFSDAASSQIIDWTSLGAVYQGTFRSRPQDRLSLGWVRARINDHLLDAQTAALAAQGQDGQLTVAESAIEMAYSFQYRPWLLLRPDMQYIIDPGTFSYRDTDNALAVGMQLKLTF
ncbi:carbohydrate porin [Solimonas sp. C16B3]|uniref:Carbohydrate porin n=2 Tax=Solimonas marina TaxID=2714601 RepID=A0A969WD12_9GAMM|nr:carbohydrate porin [Solimonas marina]